jgi:hypothetical protein
MRTTVTLDGDLLQILKETAVKMHRPFRKVLNETLRKALEGQSNHRMKKPFVVQARLMGLRSGLDPAGFNQLGDDLEAEAFPENSR